MKQSSLQNLKIIGIMGFLAFLAASPYIPAVKPFEPYILLAFWGIVMIFWIKKLIESIKKKEKYAKIQAFTLVLLLPAVILLFDAMLNPGVMASRPMMIAYFCSGFLFCVFDIVLKILKKAKPSEIIGIVMIILLLVSQAFQYSTWLRIYR